MRSVLRLRYAAGLIVFALAFASGALRAQNVGSLQGTVTDASGAGIAAATVSAVDLSTGVVHTTTTNADGTYGFTQLAPANYKVTATKGGFKEYVAQSVTVLVATPTHLDIKLEVGTVAEKIVVESAAAPALNTQDATIGNPLEEQEVKSLPMLARNVVNLLMLQPGVVTTGRSDTDQLSMGSIQNLDPREGAVDGVRGNQTDVTVDGVDANDWQNRAAFTSALPVTLDSVQEFRVTTSNANATDGLVSGAHVQLVTKSGSNEFHGNARWYYRTTGTSANSFFNKAATPEVGRPKLQRNIGGGSLGGPIKKDRAYFFLDNEERRDATEAITVQTVPSESLKDGVLIYQCSSAAQCPGGSIQGVSSSHTIAPGFFGIGPSTLKTLDPGGLGINSAMLSYMKLFPAGNTPAVGLDATGSVVANFEGLTFNAPEDTLNNIYIARIDYNITQNGHHSIFWRGSMQGLKDDLIGAQFPGQPAASQLLNNSRGYSVQYQGQLSPTLIDTARYGYTRLGVTQSGITGPQFDVRSFTDLLNFNARPLGRIVPVHDINDDLTWVKGKHTLQFGGVVRIVTNDRIDDANSFPFFGANNGFCIDLCGDVANEITAAGSGFPGATNPTAITRAFMMLTGSITQVNATFFGNPSTGSILPSGTPEARSFGERVYEGYSQDSWRVKSNIIVTYGLRYTYETPVWETNGLEVRPTVDIQQWFDQRIINMNAGIPSSASPLLSWELAGKANGQNSWYDPYHKGFAPKFALAYAPGYNSGVLGSLFGGPGKSSIRLGAGLDYDLIGQSIAVDSDLNGSPGTSTELFDGSQQFCLGTTTATCGGIPGTSQAPRFAGTCTTTGCTGLPAAASPFFTPPASSTFPFTPPANQSGVGFAVDQHIRTPYAIHLTTSFQRELPGHFTLDVAYVGTLGRRLLAKLDYAQYEDIRDPKTGVDLWSAMQQIAKIADITPSTGPVISPTNIAALSAIPSIAFFNDMLPNMPAFTQAFYSKTAGYSGLTPTQAFYAFTVRNSAPSWSCALFALDTLPSPAGLPSPWNTTVDPNRTGLVLFQPQFQTIAGWGNVGNSNYNSLQVSLRKNVGIALFGLNYVFSKSIDNTSAASNQDLIPGQNELGGLIQDPFDLRSGRALSDFNQKHNFNGYWVVDLPFGRGKKFGSSINRVANAAIGGWEFTGAARWHSGFPFSPTDGFNFPTNFFLTTPGTVIAPTGTSITRVGSLLPSGTTSTVPNLFANASAAFNNIAFTSPGLPGSRNFFTGPAYASVDMGLDKTFLMPWSEKQNIQFRATAYNVFNSVNFNAFNIDPTSPGTFGNFISTAGPRGGARELEFAVRYTF
jgi:hypothetical protein